MSIYGPDCEHGSVKKGGPGQEVDLRPYAKQSTVNSQMTAVANLFQEKALLRDGSNGPLTDINWRWRRLMSLGAPKADGDAVNKAYVDRVSPPPAYYFTLNLGSSDIEIAPTPSGGRRNGIRDFDIPNTGGRFGKTFHRLFFHIAALMNVGGTSPQEVSIVEVSLTDETLKLRLMISGPWTGTLSAYLKVEVLNTWTEQIQHETT